MRLKRCDRNSRSAMNAKPGSQRGMALLFTVAVLFLMTAVAAGLVIMTSTETSINSNYRSQITAFFAAKSGIDEAMDRMMPGTSQTPPITLPSVLPSTTGGVVYLINPGNAGSSAVQPWNYQNAYADTEFCHDFAISGMDSTPPGIACSGPTSLPSGSSWYTSVTSNAPWNGTAAALPYKWVRITQKANNSEKYLSGGSTPTVSSYSVNPGLSSSSQVCWNGTTEKVLPSGYANCAAYTGYTQVYMLTSLAVTSNGARKMVQADVALSPIPTMVYGLFATAQQCSAISMTGNAATDSYSSSSGAYGGSNVGNAGDIGSNGNISLTGNVAINGLIGVQNSTNAPLTGNCVSGNYTTAPDLTWTGNVKCINNQNCSTGNSPPPITCLQASPGASCNSGPLTFTAPPAPSPLPPTTNQSYSGNTSVSLVPGSYGNLSFSGNTTLTLAPGVYNINSLNMTGNNGLTISPTGQVVLNIAGQGGVNPLTLTGNSNANASSKPSNLLVNYAGSGTITCTGNGKIYTVINAPNAPIRFTGNGDLYGAAIGSTITFTGNAKFHFDRSVQQPNASATTYYTRIGYRELPY